MIDPGRFAHRRPVEWTNPDNLCVEWSCRMCGAKGFIDPVNEIETADEGLVLTHKLLSPDCPSAQEDYQAMVMHE